MPDASATTPDPATTGAPPAASSSGRVVFGAPASPLDAALDAARPLEGTAYRAEVLARLDECRRILRLKLAEDAAAAAERPPLVVVVGGTNVGKTTIANAIAGASLGRPTPIARGTKAATVFVPRDRAQAFRRAAFLPGYERRDLLAPEDPAREENAGALFIVEHPPRGGGDPLDAAALADSPDVDSVLAGNRRVALDLLYAADAVVFVASEEKYNDDACVTFLSRAARFGKPILAVFNKRAAQEAETDFRSKVLPRATAGAPGGSKAVEVVVVPHGGPSDEDTARLRGAFGRLVAGGPTLVARARAGAAAALEEEEARPAIAALRREAEALEHYRAEVRAAADAAAARYRASLASIEIVEFEKVFRLLADALRLPVIDDVYLRLRAATEPVGIFMRGLFGLPDPAEAARRRLEARERRDLENARVELGEALAAVRCLPDRYHPDLADALRAAAAPAAEAAKLHVLDGAYGETLRAEAERWTERVVKELHERLRTRPGVVRLVKSLKALLRVGAASAAVLVTGHVGLEDLVIAPAIDVLVRWGVEVGIDRAYFAARRDEFADARAAAFRELVHERAEALALARLKGARPAAVAALEDAIRKVRERAGGHGAG